MENFLFRACDAANEKHPLMAKIEARITPVERAFGKPATTVTNVLVSYWDQNGKPVTCVGKGRFSIDREASKGGPFIVESTDERVLGLWT